MINGIILKINLCCGVHVDRIRSGNRIFHMLLISVNNHMARSQLFGCYKIDSHGVLNTTIFLVTSLAKNYVTFIFLHERVGKKVKYMIIFAS